MMTDEPHLGEEAERLRSAAVAAIAKRFSDIDGASVWRALILGRSKIVAEFSTSHWSFLVIRKGGAPSVGGLPRRTLEIMEQVMLGTDPKVVSIERNLSASTIAGSLKQAFDAIGLRCKPSRVPLLLVSLVHAAKGRGGLTTGRSAEFEYEQAKYEVLCMPIPDRVFDRVLSPAEQAVLRMRVEGKSHAEIAAERQTSLRTVANQVATAFHRLGISCRSDLLELLIAPSQFESRSPSPAREPSSTPNWTTSKTG